MSFGVCRLSMFLRLVSPIASRAVAAILAAAATTAACSSGPEFAPPSFATANPDDIERTYRLGIGDKLKITVFGEENLSGQFEVGASGGIAMPLLGELPAKGTPITVFRDNLARKLAEGYLKNPRVNVEVLNYRPIYVHGEVKNGGEFPFKSGLRLRDAIALAGGYTYRANQNFVVVFREGQGELKAAMTGGFTVLPGDNIRIPERFF